MSRLILASRSPRRLELLTRFGVPFETFVPDVDESCDLPAAEAVESLSRRKALATSSSFFPWTVFPSENRPAGRMPSACFGCFPGARIRFLPV